MAETILPNNGVKQEAKNFSDKLTAVGVLGLAAASLAAGLHNSPAANRQAIMKG